VTGTGLMKLAAGRSLLARLRALDRRLKTSTVAWVLAPVQVGLRAWIFFGLPFFMSGLTKWETFPFLKPVAAAWNGAPQLAGGALYQFTNVCEFCFNIRIWGSEAEPLVHWRLPFPETMAALAGIGELLLPVLVLVGLATRLAALGLLAMTLVIQLVLPTAYLIHGMWALSLIAVILLGPGMISLDHLLARLVRR